MVGRDALIVPRHHYLVTTYCILHLPQYTPYRSHCGCEHMVPRHPVPALRLPPYPPCRPTKKASGRTTCLFALPTSDRLGVFQPALMLSSILTTP